jgi:hypothetical protein
MGLGNNTGQFKFVNIKKGQLAIKKENEMHFFDHIEGTLVDLEIRDDEYQGKKYKKLCLMIKDGAETFQLQMKLDSGYGYAFCSIIPNADLKLPMKIVPTYKEDEKGKGKAGMFVNQNGKALKWYYTRDNPHDLPLLEQTEFKGVTMWDNTKQQAFFLKMLTEKIRPAIVPSPNDILSGPAHELDNIPNASDVTEPIDDLPF